MNIRRCADHNCLLTAEPGSDRCLKHDGPVVLCKSGLHASLTPWEALTYAPGPILCEVEVDGMIVSVVRQVIRGDL